MGSRFRKEEGAAYARIVKDYPLSDYVDNAKKKLRELEMPIPEADVAAYNRMKWERENRQKQSMLSKSTGLLKRGPDVSTAARSGTPTMTTMRPTVPVSVPPPAGATGFSGDVTVSTAGNSNAIDTQPDARANPPASTDGKPADATTPAAPTDGKAADATTTPAPTTADQQKGQKKKKKEKKPKPAATTPSATTSTSPPAPNPPKP
jgi:outer membrane protein assembly factor BamD